MNFLYYKNFSEEKTVTFSYKKKKLPPKRTYYRDDTAGETNSLINILKQVDRD